MWSDHREGLITIVTSSSPQASVPQLESAGYARRIHPKLRLREELEGVFHFYSILGVEAQPWTGLLNGSWLLILRSVRSGRAVSTGQGCPAGKNTET